MNLSSQSGRSLVWFATFSAFFLSTAWCGAQANDLNVAFFATASAPSKIFQWRPFLAPFHSVLLHYPIGFVTMALILEVYSLFRPSAELRKITRLVMWFSLGTAAVVAALGIMRASSGDYDSHTLSLHRALGMAVPVCIVLTLVAQQSAIRAESRRLLLGYRGLLAGTFVVLIGAGHQGGNLTHGSKYLTQNAPGFVKTLLEETEPAEANVEKSISPGEGMFAAKAHPIILQSLTEFLITRSFRFCVVWLRLGRP